MEFWDPKRWTYFLPVFKAPQKECKHGGAFLDLWPLSSFHPFPPLKKGVAKNPCFIVFFHPLFLKSSTNIHQQPPQEKIEKGDGYHPLLESLFWTKTP